MVIDDIRQNPPASGFKPNRNLGASFRRVYRVEKFFIFFGENALLSMVSVFISEVTWVVLG